MTRVLEYMYMHGREKPGSDCPEEVDFFLGQVKILMYDKT